MPIHADQYNSHVTSPLIFLLLLTNHADLCHIVRGYWFKEIVLPDPAPSRAPAAARSDAELAPTQADIDAEAELYVVMYHDRAARIRAAGGLPARLDFGAPKPEIVAAIVGGTSPIFCALDQPALAAGGA